MGAREALQHKASMALSAPRGHDPFGNCMPEQRLFDGSISHLTHLSHWYLGIARGAAPVSGKKEVKNDRSAYFPMEFSFTESPACRLNYLLS